MDARLATLALFIALIVPLGATADFSPMPLSEAPEAVLEFDKRLQVFEIGVAAQLTFDNGETRVVQRRCRVAEPDLLVCPGLMTVPLTAVASTDRSTSFLAAFAEADLDPQLPATLVNVEPADSLGVEARWHWWWGWYCEIEQSDIDSCQSLCAGIGVDPNDTWVNALITGGECVAYCHCGSAAGIEIDSAPIPGF